MSHFAKVFGIAIVVGLVGWGPANSQVLDISWDQCAPIRTSRPAIPNLPVTAYASVVGQSQPHVAYGVWFVVGDASNRIPDAWRFDPAGWCGGFFNAYSQPPAALTKSCPPFVSASTEQFVTSAYQFPPPSLNYPPFMGNGFIEVSYSSGEAAPDPATRYHVAGFLFDFTFAEFGPTIPAVNCGGLETPVTLSIVRTRTDWVDTSLNEHRWEIGNGTLTYGPAAVPSRPATWGAIKGQYR